MRKTRTEDIFAITDSPFPHSQTDKWTDGNEQTTERQTDRRTNERLESVTTDTLKKIVFFHRIERLRLLFQLNIYF